MATRRSQRYSKVVIKDVGEVEQSVNTGQEAKTVGTDDAAKSVEMKEEEKDQNEQDCQKDAVIEVKGITPTVAVCWEKNEEAEGDDLERATTPCDQTTDTQIMAVESQMEAASEGNEDAPTVTVTWAKENEEEQSSQNEQKTKINRKRKGKSDIKDSPSKKTKLINDGFCIFVGNLNSSKTFEEVSDSLANYFMTQSLLVQNIRLHRSRKHAHVDLASEMDLTKALTLDGEMILDKPVKIAKAKVKDADREKPPKMDKKAARNARCLFLKNVPYNATKEDILKAFHKSIAVRFPGGTEGPSQGIAFVEFQNEIIAKKVHKKKQGVKIQGRVLIVDFVGETNAANSTKAVDKDKGTKSAPPPNNILFVSSLSPNVKEKKLLNVFEKAVSIRLPQNKGKSKGFAFVEFATIEDAEKALQASQSIKICKKPVKVQFFEMREKPEMGKVQLTTLIVMGLAEKTTAETLQSAFEGAVKARVTADRETGVSKRFGFVEFAGEEQCKAAKDTMEDCEIDGSKVTVAYARVKSDKRDQAAGGGRGRGQPAGRLAGRGGRGGRGRAAGTPQAAA